jgi:DNA-binding NarL/FixJ family response regulator
MAADARGLALLGARLVRVAVAADQPLVAESVRAALLHRGFDPIVIHWPAVGERPPGNAALRSRSSRWAAGPPPDVAVLLSDLHRINQVQVARTLVTGLDVPWLVLAGAPSGPAWGALYECGAAVVLPDDTGLDAVCDLLHELDDGRTSPAPAWRGELIRSWWSFAQRRGELSARLDSLTGREEEVLQQLYQGQGVRTIAEHGGVTEATVRSQVKAILRKLEVNSQLAAVAAYEQVQSSRAVNN